jgi:hypothetical protein
MGCQAACRRIGMHIEAWLDVNESLSEETADEQTEQGE